MLLIPEIFRLIPFEYLENKINLWLTNLEAKTKLPIGLHPPSWKRFFSEEQREKYIEPITAISGFVFSVIWVGTVIFGMVISSKFFILLGFLSPLYATLQKVISFRERVPEVKRKNFVAVFIFSFAMMILVSPLASLFRVFFLILRFLVNSTKRYFSKHMALQNLFTIFAIIAFIISNVLQLIATFLEE